MFQLSTVGPQVQDCLIFNAMHETNKDKWSSIATINGEDNRIDLYNNFYFPFYPRAPLRYFVAPSNSTPSERRNVAGCVTILNPNKVVEAKH